MSELNKSLLFKLTDPDILRLDASGVMNKVDREAIVEVEAFILAAMDKYGYDISADNKVITVHVPNGEFIINNDEMTLSDELIDSLDGMDLDLYRARAEKLFNDVNSKFGL